MPTCTTSSATDSGKPRKTRFYVVSIRKLIYMSLLTMGLYLVYWFYQNWTIYRDATGDRVTPLLRSIIPVLFIFPLLRRIDRSLQHSGNQYAWSPTLLGVSMWLIPTIFLASGLMAPAPTGYLPLDAHLHLRYLIETVLQLLATLWVICQIQKAINALELDPLGASNAHFTSANEKWMIFGVIIWGLYFFSIVMMFSLAY